MKEPDVKFLVFLTITIWLFNSQIFNYKQLALDTEIGDPSKDWWSNQDRQILWNSQWLGTLIYLYLMVYNSDSYYWNFRNFKAIYDSVRVSLISWCASKAGISLKRWGQNEKFLMLKTKSKYYKGSRSCKTWSKDLVISLVRNQSLNNVTYKILEDLARSCWDSSA